MANGLNVLGLELKLRSYKTKFRNAFQVYKFLDEPGLFKALYSAALLRYCSEGSDHFI